MMVVNFSFLLLLFIFKILGGGYRIYVQAFSQQLLASDFFHLMPNRKMSLHASLRYVRK